MSNKLRENFVVSMQKLREENKIDHKFHMAEVKEANRIMKLHLKKARQSGTLRKYNRLSEKLNAKSSMAGLLPPIISYQDDSQDEGDDV